jgi:PASTA domain
MGVTMAARILALVPRLLILTVIWLLATASFVFAAGTTATESSPVSSSAPPSRPNVLVVPDVRGKAFVFAKGILQDAGFAWRVDGDVKGYAANAVALQYPAPRTRVVDTGAPAVVLRLVRSKDYGENGLPEDAAPYSATRLVLFSDWQKQHAEEHPSTDTGATTTTAPTTTTPTTTATTSTAATTTTEAPTPPPASTPKTPKPDFVVPDAPVEPADELPLTERARRLRDRIDAASRPTKALVNSWLYQHAWIVTGARFGWHDGADALRILIRIDERVQQRWRFGARSEAVARSALAYVVAKAG